MSTLVTIHFQIRISTDGKKHKIYATVIVEGKGTDPEYPLDENYRLGAKYSITIKAGNGKIISVTYNGNVNMINNPPQPRISCGGECYFKAGNYLQVRDTEGVPVGFRIGSNLLLVDLGLTVSTHLRPSQSFNKESGKSVVHMYSIKTSHSK